MRATGAIIAKCSCGIYLFHLIALWIAFVKIGPAPFAARVLVALILTALFSSCPTM